MPRSALPGAPVASAAALRAVLAAAIVAAVPCRLAAAPFLRGDVNGDGSVNISDPIAVLSALYVKGAELPCPDAADADDSGTLDISDPIAILTHLFLGGNPPAEPYPDSADDPTPDGLGCRGKDDGAVTTPGIAADAAAVVAEPAPGFFLVSGRGISVTAAVFEAIGAARPGSTFEEVAGEGAPELRAAFFGESAPWATRPVARARDILAPGGPDGCYQIDAALLDAGSRDAPEAGAFVRGDLDGDGRVTRNDARLLADCLAGAGRCPEGCLDAADADDDGRIGPSDVTAILLASQDEADLPPPRTAPGVDPTADGLPPCFGFPGHRREPELSVEPETVCGNGSHPVTLVVRGSNGAVSRAATTVILCTDSGSEEPGADDPECPAVPMATWPATGTAEPPVDDDDKASPVECAWVYSTEQDPDSNTQELEQNVYSGADVSETRHGLPLSASGSMDVWGTSIGKGPQHDLFASRTSAACESPSMSMTLPGSGRLVVRVNLLCMTFNGHLVPSDCSSGVDMEGIYKSRVEGGSSSGPSCTPANRVSVRAQDEVSLEVNSSQVFAKAVSVASGTQVTESPSFSIDVGLLPTPGLATSSVARFGYSSSTLDETGKAKDLLDAFGTRQTEIPFTGNLWAKGKVGVESHRRTSARAKCITDVYGIWLVAKTTCPVDGPLFLCELGGGEDEQAKAEKMALDFRRTQLGY